MKTRIIGVIVAVVLALTGAVVLTGWVNGAESRAMADARLERAYVVKTRIPTNTPGDQVAQYLTVKSLPQVALVAGRVQNLESLTGLRTNTTIQVGEQLLAARFSDPRKQAGGTSVASLPASQQALTIALPLEQAVGGTLKPGDTVGVVIASEDFDKKHNVATQKLHNVRVLAVESGTTLQPSSGATKSVSPSTGTDSQMVTLALGTDGATQVVWGQKFGTVWLTLEQKSTSHDSNKSVYAGTCTPGACAPVHTGKAIDAGK